MNAAPRLLLLCCLAVSQLCGAAEIRDSGHPMLLPGGNISTHDEALVAYWLTCGEPVPDPANPPTVSIADGVITVDMVVLPSDALCGTPPGRMPIAVSLGALEARVYAVYRRMHLRQRDAPPSEATLLQERSEVLSVSDQPHAGVSGTWFDPARPGAGLSVQMLGPESVIWPYPRRDALVFLTTFDAEQSPLWLAGTGQFEDNRLIVTMAAPRAPGDTTPAEDLGTLTFAYEGCGEATVSWEGSELVFPSSTPDAVIQLTNVGQVEPCSTQLVPRWSTDNN